MGRYRDRVADLNRASPLPLYAQLARQVEARILSGTYGAGGSIPSEHALCDEFKVGRPTVRQATDELVKKGLVERRRGSGTFVLERANTVDLFSLGGTMRSFENRGLELRTRRLGRPEVTTLSDGRAGLVLSRLGYLDETPILHEQFWFDVEVFPGFEQHLRQHASFSALVERHYGLTPLGADQAFKAVKLSLVQARLLKATPGTAVLLVERSLHFPVARDAVMVKMLCRQDERYTFCQTIGGHIA